MSDMRYPVYLSDFKSEHTNVSTGSFVYEEGMAEFGYYPVIDVEVPKGDVVTEGSPIKGEDGKWYKTWESRPFTEEEIANNLLRQKEQLIHLAKSTFENENASGIQYGDHFYCIDHNCLFLYQSILSVAENSNDDKVFDLLTYDNQVVEHLKDDAISLVRGIMTTYIESYNKLCVFIKSVNEAKNAEDLPSAPDTFRTA